MRASFSLQLTLKIIVVIFLLVIFFIGYNSFLMDKSLVALDVSLQSLKAGETLGIDLLLNIDNAGEIVKEDFDESRLAKLDYLGSTILEGAATKDAQIVLSNLIDEKGRQKAGVLKSLDSSTLAFRRGISNIFTGGGKEQQLKQSLKQAVELHHNGDFTKAKGLYNNIIKSGGASRYAGVARALLTNLDKQLLLKGERDELASKVKRLSNTEETSKAYFKLGQLEMQLLNFKGAKVYFSKVLDTAPDSNLAPKAKFYLGWANKQAGNLEESVKYFEELARESEDEKLILSSRFQMADTFKRKGEYEKAAELYRDIAHKHSDSKIAPVSLEFSKFTYIFDLKDFDKANEVTAELIKSHPGSALSESARKQLKTEQDTLRHLTATPEALKGATLSRAWTTIPVLGQALKAGESAAARYAVYMIEGSIDRAIAANLDKNETLIIDIDPGFLTNYARQRLQQATKALGVSLSSFEITFPKKDHIQIGGFVKIGPKNFKFYILGRVALVRHVEMNLVKGEYNPTKWIIFTALEGKLGPFNVPVDLANKTMGKAHRIFNQKQIFRIEEFSLSPGRVYFSGPLRFTQNQLKAERNSLDQYLKLYK